MKRVKQFVVIAVLAFAALGGWQVGTREVANLELQEDMQDMVSQKSFRFGSGQPKSEDEMREAVIRKAHEYDIDLTPEQVTVRAQGGAAPMFIAADYDVPVNLPRFSFTLHFNPSSEKRAF